jgi:hypothetical protein
VASSGRSGCAKTGWPLKHIAACGRRFERYGLRHTTDLPGMVAEKLRPPTRQLPEIEIRRVRDSSTGDDFRGIGSVCFHVPIVWFNEVFDHDAVWERFAGYVGYVDGVPVATTAIVPCGDTHRGL